MVEHLSTKRWHGFACGACLRMLGSSVFASTFSGTVNDGAAVAEYRQWLLLDRG